MRSYGAPMGRGRYPLHHMFETVHFAESQSTSGIQLADVCNFIIKRHLVDPTDTDIQALYAQIETQIKGSRVWPKKMS
jgi:hypothetical protein